VGDADFVSRLESDTGRQLAPRKRGPKPQPPQNEKQDNLI